MFMVLSFDISFVFCLPHGRPRSTSFPSPRDFLLFGLRKPMILFYFNYTSILLLITLWNIQTFLVLNNLNFIFLERKFWNFEKGHFLKKIIVLNNPKSPWNTSIAEGICKTSVLLVFWWKLDLSARLQVPKICLKYQKNKVLLIFIRITLCSSL